jgi:hypothetical protein
MTRSIYIVSVYIYIYIYIDYSFHSTSFFYNLSFKSRVLNIKLRTLKMYFHFKWTWIVFILKWRSIQYPYVPCLKHALLSIIQNGKKKYLGLYRSSKDGKRVSLYVTKWSWTFDRSLFNFFAYVSWFVLLFYIYSGFGVRSWCT